MGLDYFASSPTVVMQPQSHHTQFMSHDNIFNSESMMTDMIVPDIPLPLHKQKRSLSKIAFTPPSMNYLARSSSQLSTAGRKRSREDIGEDLTEAFEGGAVQEPERPKREPIYGPGMTLIYPDDPQLNISPESQSGTWLEQRAEAEAKANAMTRPKLTARKSQRISADKIPTLSASDAVQTVIDPILLNLGIGWQRMDSVIPSPAVRGQEAFIRNQYDLTSPEIILHHEGMSIYVVRSRGSPSPDDKSGDRWWLFTEDLQACYFICCDEDELFQRLSNKRLDDRGIWRPDISVQGTPVLARGSPLHVSADGMKGIDSVSSSTMAVETSQISSGATVDVEMS